MVGIKYKKIINTLLLNLMKQIEKYKNKINRSIKDLIYAMWIYFKILSHEKTLDIHLVEHCNLKCKFCNHYSPFASDSMVIPKSLEKDLKLLKKGGGLRFFKRINLIGGEPLLHPKICSVLEIVRQTIGSSIEINIITNGIYLRKMNLDFWNSCKKYNIKINFSPYPIEIDYNKLLDLGKKYNINIQNFNPKDRIDEFWSFKLSNERNKSRWYNFSHCTISNCYQLKGERIFSCSIAAYIDHLNDYIENKFQVNKKDYIKTNKISYLDFMLYSLRAKPFCKYCIIPRKHEKWSISKKDKNEYLI